MTTPARVSFALALLSLAACKSAPDPLAAEKAQCQALAQQKELKSGLTVAECAKRLKEASDANDPTLRASELLDRVQGLVAAGKAGPQSASQRQELTDALSSLQALGRPAVPPLLKKLSSAQDPDLRIAVARVLVTLCSEDCDAQKWDCIVPAMLEGTTADKPQEVRLGAVKGLTRCTRQPFGDDPDAWRKWFASQTAATASH